MDDWGWSRLGLICRMVEKSEQTDRKAGRTALMKFAYLLKEIQTVPLDYRFTLYTYGPFDSRLLDDLSYAEALEGVKGTLASFPGGYAFEYSLGLKGNELIARAQNFLGQYDEKISSIVREFGSMNAGELEMIGTIIYIDRSTRKRGFSNSIDELSRKVVGVKPHLEFNVVREETGSLQEREYLSAVGTK